ncbi:hypothetical protein, partial [Marinobacterium mangrovicola]|uniref:hypothetical protein n=1 Tax=Marinobacterium mangrovicola TaxID=1476959 RepID=UPI001A9DA513
WKTASLVVCSPEGCVVSSEEAHSTDLPEGVNRLFAKTFKKPESPFQTLIRRRRDGASSYPV